jgi:peptidoglycan LD-endopeptidase CwlK
MTTYFILMLLLSIYTNSSADSFAEPIIDSDMTFEQAIDGTKAPKKVIDELILLNVRYYSTDGKLHQGQLVIHKDVKEDVTAIFNLIESTKLTVEKVIPIVKYRWSDDASMLDNNTSAFCYRNIAGTNRLSNHSFGKAVDINPFFNPVVYPDGRVSPKGAVYDTTRAGTLTESNIIVKEFLNRGWRWGRKFSKYADNHHFDKP